MGADVKDNWHGSSHITGGVVDIAVCGSMVEHMCFAGFPHHRETVVRGNGQLSNLASDSVLVPVREPSLVVHVELEVNQCLAYPGVDERHLIGAQVLDQACGGLWIEPKVGIGLVVHHSRANVVNTRSVSSVVTDETVARGLALQLSIAQLVPSKDTKREGHAVVSVEGLEVQAKDLADAWKPVGNCAFDRVRVEGVVLRESGTSDLGSSLREGEHRLIGLRVVDKADSFDEDVRPSSHGSPLDANGQFRLETSGLGHLELLLSVADSIEEVVPVDSIGRGEGKGTQNAEQNQRVPGLYEWEIAAKPSGWRRI